MEGRGGARAGAAGREAAGAPLRGRQGVGHQLQVHAGALGLKALRLRRSAGVSPQREVPKRAGRTPSPQREPGAVAPPKRAGRTPSPQRKGGVRLSTQS